MGDSITEDAEHVAGGGAILLVPAHGDDEVARATAVLRPHHPARLRYFDALTWRDL